MANHNFSIKPKAVPIIKTKNRIINSFIPAPGTEEILQRLDCVESRSMHGQLPVVWIKQRDFMFMITWEINGLILLQLFLLQT